MTAGPLPSSAARVLVFDSGVGGLSVGACIRQQMPGVMLTFLADNAGFPYGNQPEATVIARTVGLIGEQLARYPADVVVVACNTASTVALPALRAAISVPVVGVVPAIKPAAQMSVNRRIGVLATPATIRRSYLDDLVEDYASDCLVERIGHAELVLWIEHWTRGHSLPEAALSLALQPFRDAGVDTVVLGCTHYPLILEQLAVLLPEVRFWVDSGEAISRRAAWLLHRAGFSDDMLARPAAFGHHNCVFSGDRPPGIDSFLTGHGCAPGSM